MSEHLDPSLSAIERLFHERPPQTPPPALRSRVLAAVEKTVNKTARATTPGCVAERPRAACSRAAAGTFLMGTALSLLVAASLILAASPRAGLQRQLTPAGGPPLLSFARRAEASGLLLDRGPSFAARRTGDEPAATAGPRPRDILRSIDARSFLQGDL